VNDFDLHTALDCTLQRGTETNFSDKR
jgi:hypothetical protein